jgi:hypothetical protein
VSDAIKGLQLIYVIVRENFQDFVVEEIGERLPAKARYYEAIVQFEVKTSTSPLRVMAHLARKYPYCKEISEIIGEKVAPRHKIFTCRYMDRIRKLVRHQDRNYVY